MASNSLQRYDSITLLRTYLLRFRRRNVSLVRHPHTYLYQIRISPYNFHSSITAKDFKCNGSKTPTPRWAKSLLLRRWCKRRLSTYLDSWTPGAYSPLPPFVRSCERKGIKLITFSRAGYGGSTRDKGISIVHSVNDIRALNQHLGVERCFVGGWSGGGKAPDESWISKNTA